MFLNVAIKPIELKRKNLPLIFDTDVCVNGKTCNTYIMLVLSHLSEFQHKLLIDMFVSVTFISVSKMQQVNSHKTVSSKGMHFRSNGRVDYKTSFTAERPLIIENC